MNEERTETISYVELQDYQRVQILQQLSTNDFYMQVRNNTLNKNRNIFSLM